MKSSRASSDPGYGESVAGRVLDAVAEQEECTLLELPPLARTVDPGALDRVVRRSSVSEVSFDYHDYRVSIDGDGHVQVTPR